MGSGPQSLGKSWTENRAQSPSPSPSSEPGATTSPRSRPWSLSFTSHTKQEAERARGPRNLFRGAEQYFREPVAEDCGRLGRGAVSPRPCYCEQLGGGWPRQCPPLRGRGWRRPTGVCACAVRTGSRSLSPSLEARTFFLRSASQCPGVFLFCLMPTPSDPSPWLHPSHFLRPAF